MARVEGCDPLQGDAVPPLLKGLDRSPGNALSVTPVVIIGPELVVRRVAAEQMIRGDEDSVGSDDRFLVSAMRHDTTVVRSQSTPLRVCGQASAQASRPSPSRLPPVLHSADVRRSVSDHLGRLPLVTLEAARVDATWLYSGCSARG